VKNISSLSVFMAVLSLGLSPLAVSAEEALIATMADVAYGEHPRQKVDFYRSGSDDPTPVLIYFHGGGFVQGDKAKYAAAKMAKQCVANGISVVSANYRYTRSKPGVPGVPFPGPMMDCARVIQFVRGQAQAWNINPDRVVLTGGSAGGLMSVWVALQDDFADPDNPDLVARHSTRVSGVLGGSAQTTLDPRLILKHIGGSPRIHGTVTSFYGVDALDELETPEMRVLVERASALNYVTADDPPLSLRYSRLALEGTPLSPDTSMSVSIHHPMFGKLMCDKYEVLGLDCDFSSSDRPPRESTWAFLSRVVK
jgi:acetyl esterase